MPPRSVRQRKPPYSITLVGMMGAGKSTVGRLLASALKIPFIDTDDLVRSSDGRSVSHIFAESGEAMFRQLEQAAVLKAALAGPAVIATGGGAVLDPENRAALRAAGPVIWLTAPPAVLAERAARNEDRPLLDRLVPEASLERLLRDREAWYRLAADAAVDAQDEPARVAEETAAVATRLWPRTTGSVRIHTASSDYDVEIGPAYLTRLGEHIGRVATDRGEALPSGVLLVTSEAVNRRYGKAVLHSLDRLARTACAVVPDGDAAKDLRHLEALWQAAVEARLDRDAVVVAVGGGSVGDLAGLAAATYLRGVRFVQVPTTLLAQVDASVGGKTAINFGGGKNLVGAFHQPMAVFCDTEAMRALPERLFREGMAEAIKHGVAFESRYFEWIAESVPVLAARDGEALIHLVHESVRIKGAVVAADEREAGPRALLNLGHTFGHGLEAAGGHRGLSHGEAVAIGVCVAARLSERLGLAPRGLAERVAEVIRSFGLPLVAPGLSADDVLRAMELDKKAIGGRLRLVLPLRLGRAAVVDDCPAGLVRESVIEAIG